MKAKLFLLLLTFCLAVPTWAEGINALQLHFNSGKTVLLMFDDQPLVQFEKNDFVITTVHRTLRCTADELVKFTYIDTENASIAGVMAETPRLAFTDRGISAEHLAPLSLVSVYTAEGKLLVQARADQQGCADLQFAAMSGVVYMVQTSVANFKMTKP